MQARVTFTLSRSRNELLLIALRVLSDIMVHRRTPDANDVKTLKAAAPQHYDLIADLASDIIRRELAKRTATGDQHLKN